MCGCSWIGRCTLQKRFFLMLGAIVSAAPPVVLVPGLGSVEGSLSASSTDVVVFNGIPYATPPVGELRWRPPRPHGAWKSPRDAKSFGSACWGLWATPNLTMSEDCLFLNIATPKIALTSAAKLPVMVYIHGGAYQSGASNHNHPDMLVTRANASVVVVSLNYRLTLFGFLGTDALKSRSVDGSVGNYGIQDQRLALSWVRSHIAAFGGDGTDVTIFGESAGGNSVLNHLTQYPSFGLYSKAIIESGTYDGTPTLRQADMCYKLMLNRTGCADVDCLLRVDAGKLLSAAQSMSTNGLTQIRAGPDNLCQWGPVIDSVSLLAYPQEMIARGWYNSKVPVVLGSNRDEDALWAAQTSDGGYPFNLTEIQLDKLLEQNLPRFGVDGIKVVKELYASSSYQYPEDLGNFSQQWWTAMRIATDGGDPARRALGHCTVRYTARLLTQGGSPVVFVYLFAHPSQRVIPDINVGGPLTGTGPGSPLVPHASEVPYISGLDETLSWWGGEVDLAIAMSRYWSRFACSGNPNIRGLPTWPRYDADTDRVLRLEVGPSGIRPQAYLRKAACDFWDKHMTSGSQLRYDAELRNEQQRVV
eukprot:TRINITY_DN9609_c0_g1_i1.p1 TRINITY_DN9609_c0_g1~~TRINITY_DN9609_c0_g1_i1.p1  ORF type:complete len:587 (-),score=55.49 TRINITY_DN9609_c0_g1_i1:27-1787(-)